MVKRNVFFVDPTQRTIRPQSKPDLLAIRETMKRRLFDRISDPAGDVADYIKAFSSYKTAGGFLRTRRCDRCTVWPGKSELIMIENPKCVAFRANR